MRVNERLARAYQRQAAAIAAKLARPKPVPGEGGPLRLGAHVKLTRRVIAGPKPIDVIRKNKRAK
jgi:hypothetical protein